MLLLLLLMVLDGFQMLLYEILYSAYSFLQSRLQSVSVSKCQGHGRSLYYS